MNNSFRDGELKSSGTTFANILPPVSMFSQERADTKENVLEILKRFFEKYFGV